MSDIPANVKEAVLKAAQDGKISCTAARKIAAELKVAPRVVGEAADKLDIKIKACELGCF